MSKKIIFVLLALLVLPLTASAQEVYLFMGEGCPHCASMEEFLTELKQEYPQIEIHEYEIWYNEENRQIAEQMAQERGVEIQGVPTLFIGDEVIIGDRQDQVRSAVEKLIAQTPEDSKQEKKAQAAAINTYGAWALIALIAIGLIWAVLSLKKPQHEPIAKNEAGLSEPEE
ncbi:MAG: glutaredoxin domain-containing protein [bacterium]